MILDIPASLQALIIAIVKVRSSYKQCPNCWYEWDKHTVKSTREIIVPTARMWEPQFFMDLRFSTLWADQEACGMGGQWVASFKLSNPWQATIV
jgi:hypothetical protein